jgi:microcin C transport system permease protein
MRLIKNPITQKRLLRFKQMKRAYYSFWLLLIIYGVSLFSECICYNIPFYVHYNGQSYFPLVQYYPDDIFTGSGKKTRPDYKRINQSESFRQTPDNWMLFPIHPFGPNESVSPESIKIDNKVYVTFDCQPVLGHIQIKRDRKIYRAYHMETFSHIKDKKLKGQPLENIFQLPKKFLDAIDHRFQNEACERIVTHLKGPDHQNFTISLSTYTKRSRPPGKLRLIFRKAPLISKTLQIVFAPDDQESGNIYVASGQKLWAGTSIEEPSFQLTDQQKKRLIKNATLRFQTIVESTQMRINDILYTVQFDKEDVRFPFRPVAGHPLGLDSAGRDVLTRILHGLRISMTFGMLLVVCSMVLGICLGGIQGYYGGWLDLLGQRLTEIWNALPFLYIMILMGAVLGRSFLLLLICYGMFNWIGISYYMRAEFLRLRHLSFVEAAQTQGLPTWRILTYHILPNALTPIITFVPFSLVGAIGALAALDYLGFGLPPPTPSWGELMAQAQSFRWAWWLILYPSISLFIVMLLGVFVGEGVRNAYDPRPYSRMQ